MKKKILGYALLSLCLVGLFFHLAVGQEKATPKQSNLLPIVDRQLIVAPAIIDSLSDIIRVPTLQQGLIKHINVKVGQKVKKGQPLFSLDSSLAENNVAIHKIALEQSVNGFLIQKKTLMHAKYQLARLKRLDTRAISQAELQEKIYEVNLGVVRETQALHKLELAKEKLKNAELTLSQHTTTAPKDGIVLQINVHSDEYVGRAQPIIFLGDAKKIIVRVSIDERDNQRFDSLSPAYITSKENTSLKIPLTFIQLDRFIVTLERLNSRVQEALYYFNRDDYPNFAAGQQFDANISVRTST